MKVRGRYLYSVLHSMTKTSSYNPENRPACVFIFVRKSRVSLRWRVSCLASRRVSRAVFKFLFSLFFFIVAAYKAPSNYISFPRLNSCIWRYIKPRHTCSMVLSGYVQALVYCTSQAPHRRKDLPPLTNLLSNTEEWSVVHMPWILNKLIFVSSENIFLILFR